ncbi:MAG TPA: hypothetical protein VIT21_01185 [Chthoniobacterales bacterium]
MSPDQERASYQASIATIERITGQRPVGFNAFWLLGTPHTLGILQEVGFFYHIDDVSRGEALPCRERQAIRGRPIHPSQQ